MTATAKYFVDIFDEHLDELGFLFGLWRRAQQDPDYSLRAVGELEERIRAHLQGVQVPGQSAWPHLIELLGADDADVVFAAAYALLHTGVAAHASITVEAFSAADEARLDALTMSLAHAPLQQDALERVRALLSARPASRAAAAAEVLAFHGALPLTGEQLRYFIEDDDATARRAGWRLAAFVGAQLPPKAYAAALRDEAPTMAAAALESGAWSGVAGVLPALRQFVESPTPERGDALHLLAVLGTVADTARIQAAVADPALGPARFALAGAFGSPHLMPLVLAGLEDDDPGVAAAAGQAFTRMTGVDVESDRHAAAQPADGAASDEFDAEFQDEVFLPDPVKAHREWDRLRPQLEVMERLCRGVDGTGAREVFGIEIDMQSRYDNCLRGRFARSWQGSLLDLWRFPQTGGPCAARLPISAA